MDALTRLFISTTALYARFGLTARSTPPEQRRKFLMEEVGELIADSATHERGCMTEEAADVIVTVLGLLQSHGVTLAEINAACELVALKNDSKTTDTHELMNGKITRKATGS